MAEKQRVCLAVSQSGEPFELDTTRINRLTSYSTPEAWIRAAFLHGSLRRVTVSILKHFALPESHTLTASRCYLLHGQVRRIFRSNPAKSSESFSHGNTDSEDYSIGQEEDFDAARQKALKIGAKECYIVRACRGRDVPSLVRISEGVCGLALVMVLRLRTMLISTVFRRTSLTSS